MVSPIALVGGRDGRHLGDLVLGLDLLGLIRDRLDGPFHGFLDAALQGHGVGARSNVLHAALDHGASQDGGGGGAVAGDVVRLGGDFLGELSAHVLPRVVEFDLLRDRHTVVRDRGGSPLLVEHDVLALGAERDGDRVGELVDAGLQAAARILAELQQLRGHCVPPCGGG